MVILLVLVMFAVFVTIDVIREHRRSRALLLEGESLHNAVAAAEPALVAGFRMPPWLRYHPGHLWVHQVGPDLAYVGIDDFARRLTGENGSFSLPPAGTHLVPGQGAVAFRKNNHLVRLRTPVGGEIVGLNPRLKDDPDLPHRDCYGRGWLFKVRSPHLFKDLSGLFTDSLARMWMEDTRERFQYRLMRATGTVLQDGGAPVEDLAEVLPPAPWRAIVDEFLALRPASEDGGGD